MLDERGSMLPMTAGLVFVAFAVVALLLELSLLGAAYRDVATVADLASEAAASMIAHQGAYGSEIGIDARIAEDEAKRVGVLWGSGDEVITVDVEVRRVCVTIEDTYEPRTLAFIGVAALALRATGCAEPRSG
jgi:hypothetical protein